MPCRSTAATECQPCSTHTHTHTHTCLTALCPGLPRWASTRKVKPVWILLKQETMSGSGISCAICKSAPRSRQITMPAPHHSVFYRPDTLPATQPTVSKHWRHMLAIQQSIYISCCEPTVTNLYSGTQLSTDGTDRQTDTIPLHTSRPCHILCKRSQ